MATVNNYHYWETTIDGTLYHGGSLTTPVSVTAAVEEKHLQTFSVEDAATKKIFDVATDIGDFDYMVITSDQAVLLQIVVDDNGTSGEAYMVFTLIANLPFIMPSKVALASDGTVDLFDGTADVIERIDIKNSSGVTAKISVAAFT